MKKTRFSESQIINILKEGEPGAMNVPVLCRLHGVGQSIYYNWKSKFGDNASHLPKQNARVGSREREV
jgi:putative transposase